jgi:hypothetical protein
MKPARTYALLRVLALLALATACSSESESETAKRTRLILEKNITIGTSRDSLLSFFKKQGWRTPSYDPYKKAYAIGIDVEKEGSLVTHVVLVRVTMENDHVAGYTVSDSYKAPVEERK